MNVTITGGAGLIGRRLIKILTGAGHSVHILSRHAGTNLPPGVRLSVWDALKGEPPADAFQNADAVIHLAGAPIAQRWTPEVKQQLRDTRVLGTERLIHALSTMSRRPSVLVSSSAIGIYGDRGNELLTESSPPGQGFLAGLCVEWERQADLAEALGMRVLKIRTGIVLDKNGGALARMLPPFRAYAGGKLASGRQWMSWIHLQDLANMYRHAVENPVAGVWNGVAPNPVTNAEFTRLLGAAVGRPALLPIPKFALKIAFGEMSEVLTGSQRVEPEAAPAAGFTFQYRELEPALANLLK